ncbi:flavodoxin family protein [uncultured Algimonas sp.]|uniref:flavodoxin family protein n=1 Tax=uncultured Algimonas sp. TaxID=1547920 RepID=UPI002622095B|nr:flavodoxin family protein [uncultured Algimonas sp.]
MTDVKPDYSGLKAIFFNCSLKPDNSDSHTQTLMNASIALMEGASVAVETVHVRDHELAFGVQPDMTDQGAARDDWPDVWDKVRTADILVIGTPIWLGEPSSVCRLLIERLYAMSGQLNDKGQSIYYGKVGGVVATGNEDGVKQCATSILYALSHLGCTIPPQADCGWIGPIGPGPSYGDKRDDGSIVGADNMFTQKNTTIMSWNLMHLAAMLKDGIPSYGNDRDAWKDGNRFGFENPEYR